MARSASQSTPISRNFLVGPFSCSPTPDKMRRAVIALLSLTLLTMNLAAASEPAPEDEDYIDLFGSTTPKPKIADTTTPPPFWTSENEYDQVDMVLKREIFALYKMIYPAVLLIAAGITGLCLLVPILVFLCIMQSNANRIVNEMEKEKKEDNEEEKPQQPFESSPEWQKVLTKDD